MQSLTLESLDNLHQLLTGGAREARWTGVEGVTDKRIAQMAHVDTNLVGSAGFQFEVDMGMPAKALQHPVVGDGGLASGHNCHTQAVARMSAGRRPHHPAGAHDTKNNALVLTADRPLAELLNQSNLGNLRAGYHHQSGCILIESVDNTGSWYSGEFGKVKEQAVEQGATPVAGSGVDHQAMWFVDDDNVVIAVDNIQRDVLRFPQCLRLRLHDQLYMLATLQAVAWSQGAAIDS